MITVLTIQRGRIFATTVLEPVEEEKAHAEALRRKAKQNFLLCALAPLREILLLYPYSSVHLNVI
jgi:hypothetical protein